MKTLPALTTAAAGLSTGAAAWAQHGNMMDGSWFGGGMGGYSGPWIPVLLLVVAIALAVWVVKRK
jgi:hypothetical protein